MSFDTSQRIPTMPISVARQNLLQFVFVTALACSALLMFLVQPMVGKTLLPALGGTPQIWNTCMVFFQAMLFLGYLHAHYTGVLIGLKRQAAAHLAIALGVLLLLPIGVSDARLAVPDADHPVLWLMQVLFLSVGVPVFLIAATAPLLQKWFAQSRHPAARDPYFLYVASNAGSLVALIAYPTVVEPFTDLDQQWIWLSVGFALLVGLLATCALLSRREHSAATDGGQLARPTYAEGVVTHAHRVRWLLLSFAPSSLLLGVTTFITTDIAPVPLFWVVPLALYLMTFILAFAAQPLIRPALAVRVQAFAITLLAVMALVPGVARSIVSMSVTMHLVAFFFTALVCHGELVRTRPEARNLTEFYLWLSLGGLLGGVFNALIAPVLFSQLIEYPLVLAFACALRPRPESGSSKQQNWLDAGLPILLLLSTFSALKASPMLVQVSPTWAVSVLAIALVAVAVALLNFSPRPVRFALGVAALMCVLSGQISTSRTSKDAAEYSARTFFGIYKVYRDSDLGLNVFVHGSTVHGVQYLDPKKSTQPAMYYHQNGPFGDLFAAVASLVHDRPVAVVGLGAGGLACYGTKGSEWTFYEIDPLVEKVSRDERFFTFLRDCPPTAKVVIGDARLTLRDAPDHSQALIVIDAFTSDSIPTHLLTREAIAGYRKKLAPDGVLALHISNRHLKLAPVIGNLARDAGLVGRVSLTRPTSNTNLLIASPAELVVLTADEATLGPLLKSPAWVLLPTDPTERVWTDGYVNILRALFRRA